MQWCEPFFLLCFEFLKFLSFVLSGFHSFWFFFSSFSPLNQPPLFPLHTDKHIRVCALPSPQKGPVSKTPKGTKNPLLWCWCEPGAQCQGSAGPARMQIGSVCWAQGAADVSRERAVAHGLAAFCSLGVP